MAIEARKKVEKIIEDSLNASKAELVAQREIRDIDELCNLFRTKLGLMAIRAYNEVVRVSAVEEQYSNGLILLKSNIQAYNKGICQNITELSLLKNYESEALVEVIMEDEFRSIGELMTKAVLPEYCISDELRNIEIKKTSMNFYGAHLYPRYAFREVRDRKSGDLIMEKYMQYCPISEHKDSSEDLIRLCGTSGRSMNILYNKNHPIYAQLSDTYTVQMAGYTPTSAYDAQRIVDRINEELAMTTNAIQDVILEYDPSRSAGQKRSRKLNQKKNA